MHPTNPAHLTTALRANALFSLLTGLLLAIVPGRVGGWLGVDIDGWLRLLGIALIGHAGLLAFIIQRPEPRPWAIANLAMIAPYPLLMVGLVLTGLVDTSLGRALVLADGLVVGLIAIAQWRGLRPIISPAHARAL